MVEIARLATISWGHIDNIQGHKKSNVENHYQVSMLSHWYYAQTKQSYIIDSGILINRT